MIWENFLILHGILYKENNIKEKINDSNFGFNELVEILVSDGKMIKRPLVIIREVEKDRRNEGNTNSNNKMEFGNIKDILLGFKEEEYNEKL